MYAIFYSMSITLSISIILNLSHELIDKEFAILCEWMCPWELLTIVCNLYSHYWGSILVGFLSGDLNKLSMRCYECDICQKKWAITILCGCCIFLALWRLVLCEVKVVYSHVFSGAVAVLVFQWCGGMQVCWRDQFCQDCCTCRRFDCLVCHLPWFP